MADSVEKLQIFRPDKTIFDLSFLSELTYGGVILIGNTSGCFSPRAIQSSIQGWKLHICIHPEDIEHLFKVVSPRLKHSRIFHKFCPFDSYEAAGYGMKAFYNDDSAPGKACVVYPLAPKHLVKIITDLEGLITAARLNGTSGRTLRPYPGGVRGDLLVGESRLMYIRYGGFWGPLADKGMLYDPTSRGEVPDPRLTKPYPDFIGGLPVELKTLRRSAPAHLL